MSSPFYRQTAEGRAIQQGFERAMQTRDWNAAIDWSKKGRDLARTPASTEQWDARWYELFMIAGRTHDLLLAAQPYLRPLHFDGQVIGTQAEFQRYYAAHRDLSDPTIKQRLTKGWRWGSNRIEVLDSCVQALMLEGRIQEAALDREAIEADYDAAPALCGTSADTFTLDRLSQIVPLRLAAKGDIAGLIALANMGFSPDAKLRIPAPDQKRQIAVFASIDLGHLYRVKKDKANALVWFRRALAMVGDRPVNRGILQWYLLREQIEKLSGKPL